MRAVTNSRRVLDPERLKRGLQFRSRSWTGITKETSVSLPTISIRCQSNLSRRRIWNGTNFQRATTRYSSIVSDAAQGKGRGSHHSNSQREKEIQKQNIVVLDEFPYQEDIADEGDDDMDSDDGESIADKESMHPMPQYLESHVEKIEALITKYVDMSLQTGPGNYIIDVHEAEDIQSCIKFLESRVKRRRKSRAEVERAFHDAQNAERLLNLLIHSSTLQHDGSKEIFVTVTDFNKVLNTWRFSTLDLYTHLKSRKHANNAKEHFEQMLQYQRRIACRCVYASQCAQRLLDQMEDLASNGDSYLRPTQYSYETVLGSWSFSSRAINFVLRGEGKALGALRKIPRRSSLNDQNPHLAKNPWDDPTLLEGYTLLDPAKRADELLQRLVTMEELDGSEFKVSLWAIKQTISSWVQVKTRPRRFMKLDYIDPAKGDEEESCTQLYEELKVPARAEELLWQLVEMSNIEESESGNKVKVGNAYFRGIISSWSHSNHPDGHLNAERILTKMGELYEDGKLNTMPTPDLFNAVLGSWARRSQSMPFDAPARCAAILRHMEGIADNNLNVEEGHDSTCLQVKWRDFNVDEKSYQITFGAFRSALHCRKIVESEDAFNIATQADELLRHMNDRLKCGKDEAVPTGEIYATVAACYGKSIELLTAEIAQEHDVLKEAGVDFIGVEDTTDAKLTSALSRLNSLLEEMESGLGQHGINPDLSINAYTEVLRAWTLVTLNPYAQEEVLRVFRRVVDLYENGEQNLSPTSDMFELVINTLLRNRTPSNACLAFELLKEQERLHLEGNPMCKPSIQNYRSIIAAFEDKPEVVATVLKQMTLLYESNFMDELHLRSGNTSLGFHELLELWQNVDKTGDDAASWAESILLRVAKDVQESNSRHSESSKLLRTKNFNAVIKVWLDAGGAGLDRAANLLNEMDEIGNHPLLIDVKPDHLSFHLLMKGWIDSKSPLAGEKAVDLLNRMRTNGKRLSFVTYQIVLEALIKSSKGRSRGVNQAEAILKEMDSSAIDSERGLRPNTKLANMVLQGWAQSKERNNGVRARALLDWMLDQHKRGSNNFVKPNFPSYNCVMSACVRSSKHLDTKEKRINFDIVLKTFQDLVKAPGNVNPGSVSYRIMLSACKQLLPPGREQQHHVKAIFQHCCRVGGVDEYLYFIFLESSNKGTLKEVIEKDHNVSWDELPEKWKRNCKIYL